MKTLFQKLIGISLTAYILCFLPSILTAKTNTFQDDIPVLVEGYYYLVAGAFNIKNNAIRYSKAINEKGENSRIGINPEKDLHYVYVISTDDFEFVKTKWEEYRDRSGFSEAWVFSTVPQPEIIVAEEETDTEAIEIFEEPEESAQPLIEIPVVVEEPVDGDGFRYVFEVINSTTLKEVPGYVTVVDPLRNKVITSLETNSSQIVPDPGTAEKKVLFVCDIFGFVKQQTELNLEDPMASGEQNVFQSEDGVTTVRFELIRHKAGDIITMYQVYFYNDAAIMKPESQFELNSLLDMLQENEKLTIKIHGHTNGNAPGPIVKMAEDDNNFFTMSDNNIKGYGSAKDLSLERSKVIGRWLEDKGIDRKRMDIKGWGGKKQLYDKKSDQAKRNVRVEIEIVKD